MSCTLGHNVFAVQVVSNFHLTFELEVGSQVGFWNQFRSELIKRFHANARSIATTLCDLREE
jgi:hypothetical protein